MRTAWFVVLLMAFSTTATAAGTLQHVPVYWPTIDETRNIGVYTPDGYDETTRSYPVVYVLHGAICTDYDYTLYWGYFGLLSYLNGAIGSGAIQPVIVVTPDACGGDFGGSYYTNSVLYGNFEDYIVDDVVAWVDENYRTIDSSNHRVISGHSMGGYGAIKLALEHPDVFGAAASSAGPLDVVHRIDVSRDVVLAANVNPDPPPPYAYAPGNSGITNGLFAMSGAFSPNLASPPYFVDFPYDENGNIVGSVVDRWRSHNPPRLAAECVDSGVDPPCIWFECGTQDDRLFMPLNEAFAESLDVLGIPYEFVIHGGGHAVVRWSQALPYLLEPGPEPCAIVGVAEIGPDVHVSMRVLSTPVDRTSRLQFTLADAGSISLTVYDVAGRLIRSLHDGPLRSGLHTFEWSGSNDSGRSVSAGTYLAVLKTDGGVHTSKIVRLERSE